jgi:hypothetical protein
VKEIHKGIKLRSAAVGFAYVDQAYNKAIKNVATLKTQLISRQSIDDKLFSSVEKFYWQERRYFPKEFNEQMAEFFRATDNGIFPDNCVTVLEEYLTVLEETKMVLVNKFAKLL